MDALKNLMSGQPRDNMLPAGFSSSEAKIEKSDTDAKNAAWAEFTKHFPNADKTKFVVQTYIDAKNNITAEIFFKEGPGSLQSVFGSDSKYWSSQMKAALGLAGVSGFPYQLSPLKRKTPLPIPAVDFAEAVPSFAKIFNQVKKIYASPVEFFETKFRDIFQQTRLTHTHHQPNQKPGLQAQI